MILYTLNYVKCSRIAMMVLFSDLLFQTKTWRAEARATDVIWQNSFYPWICLIATEWPKRWLKSIESELKTIKNGFDLKRREMLISVNNGQEPEMVFTEW